ncbi:MAG TPA: hypothetical protein VNO50_17405 [Pyrinomonadaceae bacterium]|nr:hypothetical protein [Pyrinomonadaceae bacterium]
MLFERACIETDFVTCGIEPRGELLQRASTALPECEEFSANSNDGEGSGLDKSAGMNMLTEAQFLKLRSFKLDSNNLLA